VDERRYRAATAAYGLLFDRSPELDLLLLCACWPQRRKEDRQLIQTYASRPLDWRRFLLLARHHRLPPLVSHNLHAALEAAELSPEPNPERAEALGELRRLAEENAYHALHSLAELRRVVQRFEAESVRRVRVLKGMPLAQSVYGDLSMRSVGDLDLLIDESSILEADRALRELGYVGLFRVDRFSAKRLAFYRKHWKDLAYRNPVTGFEVDLHWRCFRNSQMPGAALCAGAPPSAEDEASVSFGEFRVATLPAMEGLLYLCVHGTLDGWLYLKSLVDVAAQVREMSEEELDSLAEAAEAYGVLPELSATLILVRRYLSMDRWSARLLPERDPTVAHILRYVERGLEEGDFLADRDAIPIAATLAFELGLRRSWRYRFELLLRVLFRARMWETIPLPDWMFGIYPLLSPFEWMIFRLRRG